MEANTAENRALLVPVELDHEALANSKWLGKSPDFKAWRIKGKPGERLFPLFPPWAPLSFNHTLVKSVELTQSCLLFQGFTVLCNAITPDQQLYWVRECLTRFPVNCPNNLQTHYEIPPELNLWEMKRDPTFNIRRTDVVLTPEELARQRPMTGPELFDKLRWITLGYDYNWSTKLYEASRSPFPENLFEFGMDLARVFGFPGYTAEAGFVNYYRYGDTLTGHTDRSEMDFSLPLISASFGNTAVFLIGDQTKDTTPVALFLRSGDVVVMEQESRTAFHGVPRIVEGTCPPHLQPSRKRGYDSETLGDDDGDHDREVLEYMRGVRINMNVRQVFPTQK